MSEEDVGAIREIDGFLAGKGDVEVSLLGLFLDGSFKPLVALLSGIDDDGGINLRVSEDALEGDVGIVHRQFFLLGHNLFL
jgi:hypothetical protein